MSRIGPIWVLSPVTPFGPTLVPTRGLVFSRHEFVSPICSSKTAGLIAKYCPASIHFAKPTSLQKLRQFVVPSVHFVSLSLMTQQVSLSQVPQIWSFVLHELRHMSWRHDTVQVTFRRLDRSSPLPICSENTEILNGNHCFQEQLCRFQIRIVQNRGSATTFLFLQSTS